jgi:hypothetical protein
MIERLALAAQGKGEGHVGAGLVVDGEARLRERIEQLRVAIGRRAVRVDARIPERGRQLQPGRQALQHQRAALEAQGQGRGAHRVET